MFLSRAFVYLVYLFLFTAIGSSAISSRTNGPDDSERLKAYLKEVSGAIDKVMGDLDLENAQNDIDTVEVQLRGAIYNLGYGDESYVQVIVPKAQQAAVCDALEKYIKTSTAFMQAITNLNSARVTPVQRRGISHAAKDFEESNRVLILGMIGYDIILEEGDADSLENLPTLRDCDPKVKKGAKKFYTTTEETIQTIRPQE